MDGREGKGGRDTGGGGGREEADVVDELLIVEELSCVTGTGRVVCDCESRIGQCVYIFPATTISECS